MNNNSSEQIKQLLDLIKHHNTLYRAGTPVISDVEYDALVEKLRSLDPACEWFKQIEPANIPSSRKRTLPVPMKSLNKVKSLTEIKRWMDTLGLRPSTQLVIMPKYDGISWLHDEMTGATYSRGGAENEGQDCSMHFKQGCFLHLSKKSDCPVSFTFGELVFSVQNWQERFAGKISPYTGDPYRSPRNTVAGLINRDEATDQLRHASFVRYGTDEQSLSDGPWGYFSDFLTTINREFNQPNLFHITFVHKLNDEILMRWFQEWSQLYYIDGLVIYVNDLLLWQIIGRQQTSGNPLYAIAYKNPDFTDTFETIVKRVDWKVSKAGALKPVVIIDAVDTGDCIMTSPTGYNARWIESHKIAPGAKILVTRSGGVIPKILQTIEPASQTVIDTQNDQLKKCPVCGSYTEYDSNSVELCCTNPECKGRKLAKLCHFFKTVGAENFGEETIGKLFDNGFSTIQSILNISPSEILKIEGFAEGTANVILGEMQKIKDGIDLAVLMHSSDCFNGIGTLTAQKILNNMTDSELDKFCNGNFIEADFDYGSEDFLKLPVTYQNLYRGYHAFIKFLNDTGIPYIIHPKTAITGTKYTNCFICFSGIRDKDLEAAIAAGGGQVVSGVSSKTTHLVVKDINASSNKITKAKSLGIPIYTLESFKYL